MPEVVGRYRLIHVACLFVGEYQVVVRAVKVEISGVMQPPSLFEQSRALRLALKIQWALPGAADDEQ
jgi:hypothetical protein